MRDFTKVSPTLWQSRRFLDLPSDDGRLLYLYLLTCPHQNSAGCFWLPVGYACNDLGWNADQYQPARQALVDAELIQYDETHNVVLIERWFNHNEPMNQSHMTGIERGLEKVPSAVLRDAALEALGKACEAIELKRAKARLK